MNGSDMVARGSKADHQAILARLYGAYFHDVWRWAAARGVRPSDLRDVVHDVFVAAWGALGAFEGRSSHRTWLHAITTNVVRDHRQRAHHRREVFDVEHDPPGAEDPERDARAREAGGILDRMLVDLPDEQREAFVLFELDGLTGAQIAELTGVPVQTVFSRLRAARAHVERRSEALQQEEIR